ncbi:phage tail sheath protein [Caproiciproducens galactitolivorans]|uniref:Phage tail sheath protein n=1 Tax=Caproiciproducens galactitolivorans TaxID=642589 RepID=A0A4Z0XVH4_9FIRM|nr:phage tail sheath subtilisin-like domain-containing protein [Caproiciproducens galactitolivorans]QEY34617.1 phage tail sheath protein [Caproiciproducens galactitolivorans]TGJ75419.1 phage tail sheath protein [Caproiciproducens galactitolivorans]
MGLPNINISFKNAAATATRRASRGVVAVILLDSAAGTAGAHVMTSDTQIPKELSVANKEYLSHVFLGYVNKPSKVIAYVLAADAEGLSAALAYFATQKVNYVVGPPDCTTAQAAEIVTWVKAQRADKRTPKAIVPNTAADNEGVINFTSDEIRVGDKIYTTSGYCGRIAGLIAGTPITISCTYAELPEIADVKRMTESEIDTAIDAGQFVIFHDGEKVKVGRGVNSLTTTTDQKNGSWKKIKIIEAKDMIEDDIRMLTQDNYIGKYSNTYDHKCLLITAIKEYFDQLETDGVLTAGKSSVELDLEAQEAYLQGKGIDTSKLSEQEIKTADTGSHVFLKATVSIPDTIEDINLDITF